MPEQPSHPATDVVHAGQAPEPVTGAVMPPIFLSSTYAQNTPGDHGGYVYTRTHNPTRFAFERCIARLEGSTLSESQDVTYGGFAFASGMAAMATALELVDHGDQVIAMDDLYGGSHRLLQQVRSRSQGLDVVLVNMTELGQLADAITDRTRLIWLETPTNPLLKVVDLEAVANLARNHDIITICDNTFASPLLQQPLALGFDISMHSATKYIGGHSDMLGGVLVTGRADLADRIRLLQKGIGAVLSPFDSYLALRGVKTLALRMRQHCRTASALATFLGDHHAVDTVRYPGRDDHPQHALAAQQMRLEGEPAGGGMISFDLGRGLEAAKRFLEALQVFQLAESLGGVESLAEHPAIMTHAAMTPEARNALGIGDGFVRLSVGIEDERDLRADLAQALDASTAS